MNEKDHDRRGWYNKFKNQLDKNVKLAGRIGELILENKKLKDDKLVLKGRLEYWRERAERNYE